MPTTEHAETEIISINIFSSKLFDLFSRIGIRPFFFFFFCDTVEFSQPSPPSLPPRFGLFRTCATGNDPVA